MDAVEFGYASRRSFYLFLFLSLGFFFFQLRELGLDAMLSLFSVPAPRHYKDASEARSSMTKHERLVENCDCGQCPKTCRTIFEGQCSLFDIFDDTAYLPFI